MKSLICSITVFWAVLFVSFSANGHEFIIKPVQMNNPVGNSLPLGVLSSHVYMISEEVEPIEQVTVKLVKGEEQMEIELHQNDTLLSIDGRVDLPGEGTSIISGHRQGMLWTKTTSGWKQAGKRECKGVLSSGKYEKFCKTIVNAGVPDNDYKQILGHKLEIVPLTNPTNITPGQEMDFQILYGGKPISTKVYATYDNFSNVPSTYAYFTETNDQGIAKVKITHPGTWMVRVEIVNDTPTADYDKDVTRAVLVFGV